MGKLDKRLLRAKDTQIGTLSIRWLSSIRKFRRNQQCNNPLTTPRKSKSEKKKWFAEHAESALKPIMSRTLCPHANAKVHYPTTHSTLDSAKRWSWLVCSVVVDMTASPNPSLTFRSNVLAVSIFHRYSAICSSSLSTIVAKARNDDEHHEQQRLKSQEHK